MALRNCWQECWQATLNRYQQALMTTDITADYRVKHELWVECARGNDRNSIFNQIVSMLWDTATFRILNKAVSLAPKAPEGGFQVNGLLHRLTVAGYYQSQLIAIRRLASDSWSLHGEKGVNSLRALIADMETNRYLLTRENLFLISNLEYDYEPIKDRFEVFMASQPLEGSVQIPSELIWERNERLHQLFDQLSGTNATKRKRDDIVGIQFFEFLKRCLDEAVPNSFEQYVHKLVAHAATVESRRSAQLEDVQITLGQLWKAHEAIVKVFHSINIYVLSGGTLMLPSPMYDPLVYIDKPLVDVNDIPRLREEWNLFEGDVQKYTPWPLEGIISGK